MGGGGTAAFVFPYQSGHIVGGGGTVTPTAHYSHWVSEIDDTLDASIAAATPYNGVSAVDPDTYMAATSAGQTQYRMNLYAAIVDALSVVTNWGAYSDTAAANIGNLPTIDVATDIAAVHVSERSAISSAMTAALSAAATAVAGTPIAAMVTAYETRIRKQYLRAISNMASSMADINAVNSSAFIFALAAIEQQMLDDVDHYDASLDLQTYDLNFKLYMQTFTETFRAHVSSYSQVRGIRESGKNELVVGGTRDMVSLLGNNLNAGYNAAHLQTEINRIRTVAKTEQKELDLKYDGEDALWDYKLYTFGQNMLAAAGGAGMLPKEMSIATSVLGGAATGASIGTAVAPGVGTAIGAGVGAIAGLFR